MKIRDGQLKDQTLDLGMDPASGGSALGPNIEVMRCRLNLIHPRSVLIYCSVVTDSAIHAKREAKRLNWSSVFFRRCRFTGKYSDTRFGLTSNDSEHCKQPGGLEDCDFSQAQLHLCTFHNCDPARIKFPGWPHITAIRSQMDLDDWLAIPLPKSLLSLQRLLGPIASRDTIATTIHWPSYAKKWKDTTDPESIRKLLEGKDYIVM